MSLTRLMMFGVAIVVLVAVTMVTPSQAHNERVKTNDRLINSIVDYINETIGNFDVADYIAHSQVKGIMGLVDLITGSSELQRKLGTAVGALIERPDYKVMRDLIREVDILLEMNRDSFERIFGMLPEVPRRNIVAVLDTVMKTVVEYKKKNISDVEPGQKPQSQSFGQILIQSIGAMLDEKANETFQEFIHLNRHLLLELDELKPKNYIDAIKVAFTDFSPSDLTDILGERERTYGDATLDIKDIFDGLAKVYRKYKETLPVEVRPVL